MGLGVRDYAFGVWGGQGGAGTAYSHGGVGLGKIGSCAGFLARKNALRLASVEAPSDKSSERSSEKSSEKSVKRSVGRPSAPPAPAILGADPGCSERGLSERGCPESICFELGLSEGGLRAPPPAPRPPPASFFHPPFPSSSVNASRLIGVSASASSCQVLGLMLEKKQSPLAG